MIYISPGKSQEYYQISQDTAAAAGKVVQEMSSKPETCEGCAATEGPESEGQRPLRDIVLTFEVQIWGTIERVKTHAVLAFSLRTPREARAGNLSSYKGRIDCIALERYAGYCRRFRFCVCRRG